MVLKLQSQTLPNPSPNSDSDPDPSPSPNSNRDPARHNPPHPTPPTPESAHPHLPTKLRSLAYPHARWRALISDPAPGSRQMSPVTPVAASGSEHLDHGRPEPVLGGAALYSGAAGYQWAGRRCQQEGRFWSPLAAPSALPAPGAAHRESQQGTRQPNNSLHWMNTPAYHSPRQRSGAERPQVTAVTHTKRPHRSRPITGMINRDARQRRRQVSES